jgi:hypothetical protein
VDERAVDPAHPGQRVAEHRQWPIGHGEQVRQRAAQRRVGGGSEQTDVAEATVGEQAGVDEPGRLLMDRLDRYADLCGRLGEAVLPVRPKVEQRKQIALDPRSQKRQQGRGSRSHKR